MKYELDAGRWYEHSIHTEIAILTGLPIEEITEAATAGDRWAPRDFVKTFAKLGFNTSERFIKFDPQTDKPCIIRMPDPKDKSHWYGAVYYNGWVYTGKSQRYSLKVFLEGQGLRATSMLQVWI